MYIDKNDQSIIKKFENRGFLIFKTQDNSTLNEIRNTFLNYLPKKFSKKFSKESDNFDKIHKFVKVGDLNNFRLETIKS